MVPRAHHQSTQDHWPCHNIECGQCTQPVLGWERYWQRQISLITAQKCRWRRSRLRRRDRRSVCVDVSLFGNVRANQILQRFDAERMVVDFAWLESSWHTQLWQGRGGDATGQSLSSHVSDRWGQLSHWTAQQGTSYQCTNSMKVLITIFGNRCSAQWMKERSSVRLVYCRAVQLRLLWLRALMKSWCK